MDLACTFDLPEIPVEQVKAIGEDYKTRILRNGYSLRSYYHRWSVECVWMRQYDKAKEYIDKMLNEKIDGQSCEACELILCWIIIWKQGSLMRLTAGRSH